MTDYSDALMIQVAGRRREQVISLRLGVDLEWSSRFLAENCFGDGFEPHPLLAAPEGWRDQSVSVAMSGEIRDGRGVHSQATFKAEESRTQ
jgi:hypothetical protein